MIYTLICDIKINVFNFFFFYSQCLLQFKLDEFVSQFMQKSAGLVFKEVNTEILSLKNYVL